MQVCHGDYDERFPVHTVDQAVRKAGQQAATHPRLDLRARHRESHGPPNYPVQFVKKLLPQPCRLFVVPGHRVIKLPLGQDKKT